MEVHELLDELPNQQQLLNDKFIKVLNDNLLDLF